MQVEAALFVQMFQQRYTSAALKAAAFLKHHVHRLFDALPDGSVPKNVSSAVQCSAVGCGG